MNNWITPSPPPQYFYTSQENDIDSRPKKDRSENIIVRQRPHQRVIRARAISFLAIVGSTASIIGYNLRDILSLVTEFFSF